MSGLVYPLEQTPDDPALVGGKAASLGRLLRAGLAVPPGFALTVDAARAFVDANKTTVQLPDVSESARAGLDTEVLSSLRAGAWPEGLRSQIEEAYAALVERSDGAPVAVRSSAVGEDAVAASFAGQHLTMLNLQGLSVVLDAVLACWASLYSETALHYRRARGVEGEPAMAIVVQALVPAEASGVVFTIDPVSGDRELVVIEAVWGLGEGIVAGAVSPDHYVVRKADLALVRRQVTEQRLEIAPAPGGGTQERALSADRGRRAVLSEEQIVEMARLALRMEELAGVPQDIEWALANDRLYILQSRPVTAAGQTPRKAETSWVSEFDTNTDPETFWTAANVQEVLPGQLSPYSCSINKTIIDQFGGEPLRRVGLRVRSPDPFFAFFYGRPFLNLSMMWEVAEQSPFGSPEVTMEQFLGQGRSDRSTMEALALSAEHHRSFPGRLLGYVRVLPRVLWFTLRMPAEIRRAERIIEQFELADAERPFAQQSDEDLVRTLDESLPQAAEVSVTHVSGGGITSSSFESLRRCTERWLDDENGALQAKLCSGLAGVESALPAYELWALSRLVLASDALREAFVPRDGEEIEKRLGALEGEEIDAFRHQLERFIEHHGHRSVMEAEVAAKSWEEDLPTVFAMLRNYLAADESADPLRIEERQRREREQATRDALQRLNWWRRLAFRFALRQAQEWVVKREHTKSLLVRSSHRGRLFTRELARRVLERGLLDQVQDFYYLTQDETRRLVLGSMDREETYALIRRRKAEEERNRNVILPELFKGRPEPLTAAVALPQGNVLRGIAVSPGRVSGRARVILDPRQDATIEPGEILVAPVTDAGWTPLFIAAAGIVVDIGGTLSHGSTVAREFGLPAVVNVKHGTRMIHTGQMITVDGAEGVVILEEGE